MEKRKREEYEMQLFGFHSRAVNATLNSLIQTKIQSRCDKLCESLEKKYKPDAENIEILKENKEKLMNAYYVGCRPHLPALKNCIEKLIDIPEYILLDEDKIQVNQYSNENVNDIKDKLENLQRRLKKAIIFNAILKEEIDVIGQFNENFNEAESVCDVIDNGIKYPGVNDVIIKMMDNYKQLQSCFNKADNLSVVKNKRNCLTHVPKYQNTNS